MAIGTKGNLKMQLEHIAGSSRARKPNVKRNRDANTSTTLVFATAVRTITEMKRQSVVFTLIDLVKDTLNAQSIPWGLATIGMESAIMAIGTNKKEKMQLEHIAGSSRARKPN